MPQLDIKLLLSLISFAESKNINDAAERLGISQPALSRHLQQLEEVLPQKLFTQMGRRKCLTPYAQEIYLAVRDRFKNIDGVIQSVGQKYLDESQSLIRIAARKEILGRIVDQIKFKGRIHFIESTGAEAGSLVIQRQADLAISSQVPDSLQLHAKRIFKSRFILILPKQWQMKVEFEKDQTKVLKKDLLIELLDKPFLSYKSELPYISELIVQFRISQDPRAVRIFSDWPTLVRWVDQGIGWALVPSNFVTDQRNLKALSLSHGALEESNFYCLSNKEDLKIPWFRKVADQLAEIFHREDL